ncbi:PREDICTED: L-threonine dehydratase catabolic TdcB-like [Priapulus caudatus]|uniref:L-serine deaminase n=1 Tax=Priapulus caudatus TaxID=37621 RepID=A0ABM1EQV5_PRICU|nr:PREDICTED: L-threonine dehydratase catabolic TdcB-like [Priapulus caudatus]
MSQISCVANASITKLECNTCPLLTLEELKKALVIVQDSHLCRRTPMLYNMQDLLTADATMHLHLKMESMQPTGSFKVRGLANQLANLPDNVKTGRSRLITMSGGNYGKAFAYALSQMGLKGLVVMPTSVPTNRIELIEGFGMEVELVAKSEMMVCVNRHVKENGMTFLHSFDDPVIIAGHSSIGV